MASNGGISNSTYWAEKWPNAPMPWEVAIVASVFSGILCIVGTLTNALVIFLITQMKRHQELENMDILILSLCFSDFLSSAAIQPQLIFRILPRSRVPAAQSISAHVSTHITLISGCLSLFIVTLERYLSIKFPFRYAIHATKTKVYLSLAFVWTTTLGFAVFIIEDGQTESQVYPVLATVVFTLTIILHAMIFMMASAQHRNMRRQVEAIQHNQVPNDSIRMERQANAYRFKTSRTILFMCVVFIATWLPSIIFRLYYVIDGNLTFYVQWLHAFNIILQLHSCINPYIYVLRTRRVKQVFSRLFARS